MNLDSLLEERREVILDRAAEAVRRAHLDHYGPGESERTRERLERLFDLVRESVGSHRVNELMRYSDSIAAERFASGFLLFEVQTAYNVLEEAIWHQVLERVPPEGLAEALGLVSTVLGMGKDALARRYVSLASRAEAPSLDLSAIFKGKAAGA